MIKLDRSLVMNLHEDPAKEALCDSFVRFARRTSAVVCAEGIETMEELKLLADLDVTHGQGYVLARPAEGWATVSTLASNARRRTLRRFGDVSLRSLHGQQPVHVHAREFVEVQLHAERQPQRAPWARPDRGVGCERPVVRQSVTSTTLPNLPPALKRS